MLHFFYGEEFAGEIGGFKRLQSLARYLPNRRKPLKKIKKGPLIPLAEEYTERQAMKAWENIGWHFPTLKVFRKFIRVIAKHEQYPT